MGDFKRNFDRRSSGRSSGGSGRFDRNRPSFGSRGGGRDRRDRGGDRPFERQEMHSAVCDKCGEDCEVPFRPTQGKPIYCSDCFKDKSRESGSRSVSGKQSNENLDHINKKLDKILNILESAKEHFEEKPESKKPKKKVIDEEKPKKKAKKKKS